MSSKDRMQRFRERESYISTAIASSSHLTSPNSEEFIHENSESNESIDHVPAALNNNLSDTFGNSDTVNSSRSVSSSSDSSRSVSSSSDSSRSENSSFDNIDVVLDDVEENLDLQSELAVWATTNKCTRDCINQLLDILSRNGHNNLPKDSRTLLRTPRRVDTTSKCGGEFFHILSTIL